METTKLSSIYKDTFFKRKDKIFIIKIPYKDLNNNDTRTGIRYMLDELSKNISKKYILITLPTYENEYNIKILPENSGREYRSLLKIKETISINYLAKKLNINDES